MTGQPHLLSSPTNTSVCRRFELQVAHLRSIRLLLSSQGTCFLALLQQPKQAGHVKLEARIGRTYFTQAFQICKHS